MTMIIANVLPDRSAGFIATDTRCMHPRPGVAQYADCGGKLVASPGGGWGAVTSSHGPRCRELLLALRDTPIEPSVTILARLDAIVAGAFARAEAAPGVRDEDTLTEVIELQPASTGACLVRSEQGRTATPVDLVACAPAGSDVEAGRARQATIAEAFAGLPVNLAARIQWASAQFSAAAADTRPVSGHLNVGFLCAAPDGRLQQGFLSGPSAAIASSAPGWLLDRFLAPFPTLTAPELLRDRVRRGLPAFEDFAA